MEMYLFLWMNETVFIFSKQDGRINNSRRKKTTHCVQFVEYCLNISVLVPVWMHCTVFLKQIHCVLCILRSRHFEFIYHLCRIVYCLKGIVIFGLRMLMEIQRTHHHPPLYCTYINNLDVCVYFLKSNDCTAQTIYAQSENRIDKHKTNTIDNL